MAILGPTTINGNLTITGTLNGYTIGNIISKNVDETISSATSTNIPTSKAIADYVNSAITSWKTANAGKITVNGKTVNISAGYYAANTSRSVADGAYSASVSLTAGAGSVVQKLTSNNVSATESATAGTYYVKVDSTGSGTVSAIGTATIGTAGYIAAGSKNSAAGSKASNSATTSKYYNIPAGSVTVGGSVSASIGKTNFTTSTTNNSGIIITASGKGIPQYSNTAGYIPAHSSVNGTVVSGSTTEYLDSILIDSGKTLSNIYGTNDGLSAVGDNVGTVEVIRGSLKINEVILGKLIIGRISNKGNQENPSASIVQIDTNHGLVKYKYNTTNGNTTRYWNIREDNIGNLVFY